MRRRQAGPRRIRRARWKRSSFRGDGKLSPAARALGAEAVARLAERAGQRQALSAALDAAATAARDPSLRAWVELRHASSVPASDSGSRAIAFEEALRIAPAHPLALPIYLSERSVDTAGAAAALARAGQDATIPAFAQLASLAAVSLQALSGDHAAALRAAQDLLRRGEMVDRQSPSIERLAQSRCAARWRWASRAVRRPPRRCRSAGTTPRATTRSSWLSPRPASSPGDAAGARELFRTLASGVLRPTRAASTRGPTERRRRCRPSCWRGPPTPRPPAPPTRWDAWRPLPRGTNGLS